MTVPTIFDLCEPRADVLAGSSSDDFAADLAQVIRGSGGPAAYRDPARVFAKTYPTCGLTNLLANVCARLSGSGEAVAASRLMAATTGGPRTALAAATAGCAVVVNASSRLGSATRVDRRLQGHQRRPAPVGT